MKLPAITAAQWTRYRSHIRQLKAKQRTMNLPQDDGGPIASRIEVTTHGETQQLIPVGGMSLRDWFAGMALQGILSSGRYGADTLNRLEEDLGPACYMAADEMLAARKETP